MTYALSKTFNIPHIRVLKAHAIGILCSGFYKYCDKNRTITHPASTFSLNEQGYFAVIDVSEMFSWKGLI
jgi:hypothetical protein